MCNLKIFCTLDELRTYVPRSEISVIKRIHKYKVQIKSLLQKEFLSHNSLSTVIPEQTTNTYYVLCQIINTFAPQNFLYRINKVSAQDSGDYRLLMLGK